MINESEIEKCIDEILEESTINETHGVNDSGINTLARKISNKFISNNGEKFRVTKKALKNHNIYFDSDFDLTIEPIDESEERLGYYNLFMNTLGINKKLLNNKKRLLLTVSHELSHYIDNNMRTKKSTRSNFNDKFLTYEEKFANSVAYAFRDTEMQARLNEYYMLIKNNKLFRSNLMDGDIVLHISDMEKIINKLKKLEPIKDNFAIRCIFTIFAASKRNSNIDNIPFKDSPMPLSECLKFTSSLIRKLEKKLYTFKCKASKILYDVKTNQL